MTKPDIDAFTVPPFSVLDGIEGIYADDDRTVELWSHYHAIRVNTMLRILRARIRAFQWQVTDLAPRGDAAAVGAAEQHLANVRAELSTWESKRDLLEKARLSDSYAPAEWHWE
jgi:hypothetical protein